MAAYLVRNIDNLRLIGIFVSKNPVELFWTIDEELDPFECEYFCLKDGEGVHLDAVFGAEMLDDGRGGKSLSVGLANVEDPEQPKLTERLSERLDRGRSWTTFRVRHFVDANHLGPLLAAQEKATVAQ